MNIFPKDGIIEVSSSPHSPHNIIPKLIKEGKTVLDIGCNCGILGQKLKNNRCIIDGVDINTEALLKAKNYYHQLFERDLSCGLSLPKYKYDYIVLSDILEHLSYPEKLLNECHSLLKPKGVIIVSLPNIARLEIRLNLLFGKFQYSPGILNPDHLRHFTLKTSKELFSKCNYNIQKIIPTGFGHKIKIFPTLLAFQFVFVCGRRTIKKRCKNN